MAARMAMMADDISQVLKDDSKAGRDAPPLALAYRYAVERQEKLQRGMGLGPAGHETAQESLCQRDCALARESCAAVVR